jgi:starch phosphorylase
MSSVSIFTVVPKLPEQIAPLRDIAFNMWWCSDSEAIELFFRIDRDLWEEVGQNPVRMLGLTSQERLHELAEDDSFLSHLDRVHSDLKDYLSANPWAEKNPDSPEGFAAAYFSAEFGIHESVSIYSGGLGVLAGDHLKSASDLGLPLVGVGLLYREGYHRQYLNADGWQQEEYPLNDFYNMPLEQVLGDDGAPLVVDVQYPERVVKVRVWKLQVGRVPLYLLDTDFDANDQDDREITGQLYGGDRDMRIRQEIILGMGGVRALMAMGIRPSVYHMNEGHAAFMTLERVRNLLEHEDISIEEATEAVKVASVFTTHTPVPAGNDMFSHDVIERYFSRWCDEVGMPMHDLLALGRQNPEDTREPFCMTVLALKLSSGANGVSALHGKVARGMWARTFPDIPEDEVPITSITNGIHPRFWVSREMQVVYDRYLGPNWRTTPSDEAVWGRIAEAPDAELWRTHERRRSRLVAFARRRLHRQLRHRGSPPSEVQAASEVLDPEVLTIGFARRFATYKRANLLLRDPDRLHQIITNPKRPVQFIVSGKAHPQDNQGKELIRNFIHYTRQHNLRNQIMFIENYDINVGRYMVQGVDCWLNTPRRPMEASGTSGMKVALNGGLNISIPDGWWCEAELLGENGWSIGRGEEYDNPEEQDRLESEALYDMLENDIAPMFYDRQRDDVPREWVERMKTTIGTIGPVFNTHRMVQDYADAFYIPSTIRRAAMRADGRKRVRALADWKRRIRENWSHVAIRSISSGPTEALLFGSKLKVTAEICLGNLTPDDIILEVYFGDIDPHERIPHGQAIAMKCQKDLGDSVWRFDGALSCEKTGQQGFMVRAIPSHPDLAHKHEMALITWA